jgi:tetratricopeptide (TPR) repeat protein
MKTVKYEPHGFTIDVPKKWMPVKKESIFTKFGHSIGFWCNTDEETFNIQIGMQDWESLEHVEREFRRYSSKRQYTELEFGRILVEDKEHVWARYQMGARGWAKKYFIVFGPVEYAITANCFDRAKLTEKEQTWDKIVQSFKLIPSKVPQNTPNYFERMNEVSKICEKGHSYFQAGKYVKALEQFEKSKLVSQEFTWGFLGTSMTLMQMIEVGMVPDDELETTLIRAESNLEECLLISPKEPDYHQAMEIIQEYKKRYGVA